MRAGSLAGIPLRFQEGETKQGSATSATSQAYGCLFGVAPGVGRGVGRVGITSSLGFGLNSTPPAGAVAFGCCFVTLPARRLARRLFFLVLRDPSTSFVAFTLIDKLPFTSLLTLSLAASTIVGLKTQLMIATKRILYGFRITPH